MNKIKLLITISLLVVSAWILWPSFRWVMMSNVKKKQMEESKDPILNKILRLGLDLNGGIHLLFEVDDSRLDGGIKTNDAVDSISEIIRNRIDQFGVMEPMIVKQSYKWILVQFPSTQDVKFAKDLIGKMALLEFKIVNRCEETNKILKLFNDKGITPLEYRKNPLLYPDIKAIMPKEASIFESKEKNTYYILDKTVLTGSVLTNAKVEFDERSRQAVVLIEFNKRGKEIFADVTEKNTGKNLAIVLDDVVQSVPIICSKIPDGKAFIEGNFNYKDAKLLATILRAGALPAPVKVIEEKMVGPSLGNDSIKRGFIASFVGVIAVFVFMIVYYRFSGLIADISLFLNLIILMAVMTYFKFTITLPGIAGIALMLAMSVDANVLIIERIREELNAGKTIKIAIDTGYRKVFWTVFDANVTTLIASVFLFKFGIGPIKGFAVTLSIGLIISMFTSVSITKLIYDFLFKRKLLRTKI
ncbi:MAG: protein translocase subunit SecD [Endomicrobium sp.]|jgi:protein-export membrane protein SecD|nr:protein translocase subunit SecD [Endomicrobium sp.]